VYVPVGKQIRVNKGIGWPVHFGSGNWNNDWEDNDYYDSEEDIRWQSDVDYVMKADGELADPNRVEEKKEDKSDDYRYNNKEQLRQNIKEREKLMEDEKRRLEEDKKRLNDTTHPKSANLESADDNNDGKEDDAISSFGSPVFALANMFN